MPYRDYKPKNGYAQGPLKILNNPIDTGYMVKTKHKTASQSSTWNAMLIANDGTELKMWAEEVEMNFSMSGSSAQSRYKNQFFPHSFNQPTMVISGRMPNQYEYNKLATFIRETHFDALNQTVKNTGVPGQIGSDKKTIRLYIKDAGGGKQPKRNQKGGHLAMGFQGYIKSIPAGATKFEFAPNFKFEFVIAGSSDTGQVGIYSDTLAQGSRITSWMDLFKKHHFSWGAVTFDQKEAQLNKAVAPAVKAATTTVDTLTDVTKNLLGNQK